MAKYSDKRMGKEVGTAAVYAPPHTMSGKPVSGEIPKVPYATEKAAKDVGVADPVPNGMSYGMAGEPKTTGIITRGNGAATKGITARGPMA
jgi:hypothetical protein